MLSSTYQRSSRGGFIQSTNASQLVGFPSLMPGKDEVTVVLDSLAEMHIQRVPINWDAYFRSFNCRQVELPAYTF